MSQILVSEDFVRGALDARFAQIENYSWGQGVPEVLREFFIDLICDCGVGENDTPSSLVDNFVVNSRWEYLSDSKMSLKEAEKLNEKGEISFIIESGDPKNPILLYM